MKILVACEESQAVCIAFRELGHEAYSCDKKPCSGGRPAWHIIADALDVLYGGWFTTQSGVKIYIDAWDKVIAHPPCDRLTYAGVRWLDERNLWMDLKYAIDFFNEFREYGERGNSIAIENPIPHRYAVDGFWLNEKIQQHIPWRVPGIGKYHQKFHPWHFGHKQMKSTCLWLYNMPCLIPTNIVGPPPKEQSERNKWQDIHRKMGNTPERKTFRSKTFPGIARAMALQWGGKVESKLKVA
jgi:hypothetical protein